MLYFVIHCSYLAARWSGVSSLLFFKLESVPFFRSKSTLCACQKMKFKDVRKIRVPKSVETNKKKKTIHVLHYRILIVRPLERWKTYTIYTDLEETSLCSIVESCGSCAVLLVDKLQFLYLCILYNRSNQSEKRRVKGFKSAWQQ